MKKLQRLFAEKSLIQRLQAKKIFGVIAAGAGLAAFGAQAQAQVIIQDDFTSGTPYRGSDGSFASYSNQGPGLSPGVTNTPGGSYVITSGSDYHSFEFSGLSSSSSYALGTVDNFATVTNSVGVSIASTASYTEPSALTIAGSINVEGHGSGANEAYLGFFSAARANPSGDPGLSNFVGLGLTNTGSLEFIVDGTATPTTIAAGTGIFDANGFTTLSFNLAFNSTTDIATLSGIVLNGVSYSSTTLTTLALSPNTIEYAGFGGTASGPDRVGTAIDSFTVSGLAAAPEPSVVALLASGGLMLGAFHYRRRQQAGN